MTRFLRYLAPNLVTVIGMLFGLMSMVATFEQQFVAAAWFIIWAVLLDRLDGLVARTLKATSEFGVQMDSFADAINFGVAPAVLMFVSLSQVPELGFTAGAGRALLLLACGGWVVANVFRLAKFNVVSEDAPGKTFFGVPTTLAAGTLIMWYLVLHKYGGGALSDSESFWGPRLLGSFSISPRAWSYLPAAMLAGALLMVSNLPTPKLGATPSRPLTVVLLVLVVSGYVCAFMRVMPEFMALLPTSWLVMSLVWGQLSSRARELYPPSFLPLDEDEASDEDELAPDVGRG